MKATPYSLPWLESLGGNNRNAANALCSSEVEETLTEQENGGEKTGTGEEEIEKKDSESEGRRGGSKPPQSPGLGGRAASETDKHRHGSLNLILVVC